MLENRNTRRGFTILELLVTVLIIGILAAVALPQYQRAIDKTRYAQARTVVESIWQAQQRYYFVNEKYASRANELDIDIPGVTIQSAGSYDHYYAQWGVCWSLPASGYIACEVYLGSSSTTAWYFAYLSGRGRQCWANPKDNARANTLCKAVTKKTGKNWFDKWTVYSF